MPFILDAMVKNEGPEVAHNLFVGAFHKAVLLFGVGRGGSLVSPCHLAVRRHEFVDELGPFVGH